MNKQSLGALIALNVVLLLALLVVTFTGAQPAQAQLGGGPGPFLMIAGEVTGRQNQAVVYITDLKSARVVAMIFNSSNNELTTLDFRDLATDVQSVAGPGGR
ncbi:MAG: hypothetical protein WD042_08510 [Phycisphaeraceae bacterium]